MIWGTEGPEFKSRQSVGGEVSPFRARPKAATLIRVAVSEDEEVKNEMASATCPTTNKKVMERCEAMRAATWWRRNRHARMGHYRCRWCDGWHIGNNHRKPGRRR